MPQLSQLGEVLLSQLFWLAIALGFIFFVIARGMVPKIQSTVDAREQKIVHRLSRAREVRHDEVESATHFMDSCQNVPGHSTAAPKRSQPFCVRGQFG